MKNAMKGPSLRDDARGGQSTGSRPAVSQASASHASVAATPEAILVRTPNWLGDLMMSTGFLRALLSHFPDTRVDLIVRKGFETLPLPHRGEVIPFDKHTTGGGAFGSGLRDRSPDSGAGSGAGSGRHTHFFVLPPSFSSAWMAFRSGIPWRIGYAGQGRRWLLRPARPFGHEPRSVHLLTEYLHLLRPWFNATAEQFPPRLALTQEWLLENRPPSVAAHRPSGNRLPYVVLAPGAEYGPAKQWPTAHYAALAQNLAGAGHMVIIAGLPRDRDAGEEILAAAPGGLNLCGHTTLPEMVALLADAALVVSNDSGAMHIAAALGIPQIALFGSSNPAWTSPVNKRAEVIYRGLSCSPCYRRTCPLGHTDCLMGISPRDVAKRALEKLEPGR